MASGDVKIAYAASASFTVTNLHSLASSATFVAGWESNSVVNTSNLYVDYMISGVIFTHASVALTANTQIRVYVVGRTADATWPNLIDGTESTLTWTNIEMLNSAGKLGAVIGPATTVNLEYPFGPFSVAALFGGQCPAEFVVFISHNTGQNFDSAGSIVTYKGVYYNVAP